MAFSFKNILGYQLQVYTDNKHNFLACRNVVRNELKASASCFLASFAV